MIENSSPPTRALVSVNLVGTDLLPGLKFLEKVHFAEIHWRKLIKPHPKQPHNPCRQRRKSWLKSVVLHPDSRNRSSLLIVHGLGEQHRLNSFTLANNISRIHPLKTILPFWDCRKVFAHLPFKRITLSVLQNCGKNRPFGTPDPPAQQLLRMPHFIVHMKMAHSPPRIQ